VKKRWLIFPLITLSIILIFTFIPASFVSASPGNLVLNGDFSNGGVYWSKDYANFWDFGGSHGGIADVWSVTEDDSYIWQSIETGNNNLELSFDVFRKNPGYDNESFIVAGFNLYKDAVYLGYAQYNYEAAINNFPLNVWSGGSFSIAHAWKNFDGENNGGDLPDFDWIKVWVNVDYGGEAYFDNIMLTSSDDDKEEVWVRTQEMTCKQVWVNEDNKFQFSFIYPYRDNNWVRIYDMAGIMVYEVDMPYDNPNIIVDLPDGTYTVKTFHDQIAPIQEFVIGKP
jgi:hypothetical protein